MKNLLVLGLLVLSMFSFGQTDTSMSEEDSKKMEEGLKMLFASKIEMDIDKSMFTMNEGNMYFTEDQKTGIVAMAVPQSFAKMKENMGKDKKKEGMELVDKGEITINGQNVLFMKNETKKEGQDFIILIYAKEIDAETSMMITSFFEKSKEAAIKPLAEKAIVSAKLVKE